MTKRVPIILGLLLLGLALWLLVTPNPAIVSLKERLDNFGYDLQLQTLVTTQHPLPHSPVVIVDIDDKSIKVLGRRPWPRSKLGELVHQLQSHGASVIAFDIFFPENEINLATSLLEQLRSQHKLDSAIARDLQQDQSLFIEEDAIFAESLAATQSILALGFVPNSVKVNQLPEPLSLTIPTGMQPLNLLSQTGYISNIPILQRAAKANGYINIFPDNDGVVRHVALLLSYYGKLYPSLALQVISQFANQPIELLPPNYIKIGKINIPIDSAGQVLVPFIGKSYIFPHYSAIDVINNTLPNEAFKGQIVLIGSSASGVGDLHTTAIQSPFPGLEIQATIINGILDNLLSIKPTWETSAVLCATLILGLIAVFLFPYLGAKSLGAIIIFLPPTFLMVNHFYWLKTNVIISFLIPDLLIIIIAFINMVYGYLFETLRRERLKKIFDEYVPDKHIEEMLKSSDEFGLCGEDRNMTVLFADIRNFTTISENLSAAVIVNMLNTLFTPMTEIIFKNQGTIDKFVGDLIMAFWGAPLKDEDHARHAIQAALEMQERIKMLRPLLLSRGWPEIHIGIGINSGNMSVGDMGSHYRRNYTVIGDAVNLAARLESLTKFYGVNILVSEKTQQNQPGYLFRQVDRVRVKGKNASINIYEVIGTAISLTPELDRQLAQYQQALYYYFNQEWKQAETLMRQLYQQNTEDRIYAIYIERINKFKNETLPADWDGVFEHSMS